MFIYLGWNIEICMRSGWPTGENFLIKKFANLKIFATSPNFFRHFFDLFLSNFSLFYLLSCFVVFF